MAPKPEPFLLCLIYSKAQIPEPNSSFCVLGIALQIQLPSYGFRTK
jgi:hypothetical protein